MVTIDEAALCPKCKTLGQVARNRSERKKFEGKMWDVCVYICVNEGCNWFNTGWVVQSDDRGVVYERPQGPRGQDKQFNKLSRGQMAAGRAMVEEVIGRDAEEETPEVRKPGT